MPDSNAVEYERKRDAITDLKEDYSSYKILISTCVIAATVLSLAFFGCATGIGVDSHGVLASVVGPISFFLGIISWVAVAFIHDDSYASKRKAIRDAEREFKYWSIDNPPC